jgi:hypothetical protein
MEKTIALTDKEMTILLSILELHFESYHNKTVGSIKSPDGYVSVKDALESIIKKIEDS